MKKLVRLLAIALVLAALLAACGRESVGSDPTDSPTTTTAENQAAMPTLQPPTLPQPDGEIQCQILPEEVDNPDDLPVLNWVCLTYYYDPDWPDSQGQAINEALEERDMPFRVQFTLLAPDDRYSSYREDWFENPEIIAYMEEADLIYGPIRGETETAFLRPITKYVTGGAEPSLQNAVPHEDSWIQATLDGEIYGVPTGVTALCGEGWWVSEEFYIEHGLTDADFSKPFWEMEETFITLYELNDKQPFFYNIEDDIGFDYRNQSYVPEVMEQLLETQFQMIGSCYAVDFRGDTPKVVNYLDTEYTRNYLTYLQLYKSIGYVQEEEGDAPVMYSWVFGDFAYNYAGYRLIPVGESSYRDTAINNYLNGVAADTEYEEEAVTLLNLLAEDEEFRKLFWQVEEGASLGFLSMYSSFDRTDAGAETSFPTAAGKTSAETYADMLDNTEHYWLPVSFDFSDVKLETYTVNSVLNKKLRKFSSLTAEDYDKMLQDIEAAGNDKILEELQEQLDDWLAEHPDWNS